MDFQSIIDAMNETQSKERGNYHLTFGNLIDALNAAPSNAVFDERVVGFASYRGYYTDIALFTKDSGIHAYDQIYDYDSHNMDRYKDWKNNHTINIEELPKNPNVLGALLESLLGKYFQGWKGGDYKITRDTPLWLEKKHDGAASIAIVAIDKNLNLITKDLDEEKK